MKLVNREELLPEGPHLFTVIDAKEQQSKAGNDMLVIDLEAKNGDRLRDFLVVTGRTEGWVLGKVSRILGHAESPDELDFDPASLIGRKVYGDVYHETYEGKPLARVRDYARWEDPHAGEPDPFAGTVARPASAVGGDQAPF